MNKVVEGDRLRNLIKGTIEKVRAIIPVRREPVDEWRTPKAKSGRTADISRLQIAFKEEGVEDEL